MIYIKSFKNYDEFKQLFGIVEHGNGAKSRKNKILLACLKNRKLLKWWLGFKKQAFEHGASVEAVEYNDYLRAANMDELKRFAKLMLNDAIKDSALWNKTDDAGFKIEFAEDFCYGLYSPTLKIDKFHGLCVDGDSRSIRYVNTERANKVFKMKAGKFISKCIEDNRVTREFMPEQMKRWIGEEFAREWQSYAEQNIGEDRYILYVDDNFSDIYDSDECDGDFGSCMTDKDYYSFYEDAINCKAAYLRDAESNLIVARCIVYQDVHDENGNSYRLAERQYARDQDDVLKQMLVDMLIKAGEIDGYKRVGADCHDNRNFVFNNGESMRELDLCIDCRLDYGDTLSYQDSFVYYNYDNDVAYNNDYCHDYSDELNSTDGVFRTDDSWWSEWNNCYISEDESVFDDYYEDYIYPSQAADAIYNGEKIRICNDRVHESDRWRWSDKENAFIHKDEAYYVERENDYFTRSDVVEDINEEWQLEEDCVWSTYYGEYILEDDSVWSAIVGADLLKDRATKCPCCGEWYPDDYKDEVYSEITNECYCSDDCLKEAEEEYRAKRALVCVA